MLETVRLLSEDKKRRAIHDSSLIDFDAATRSTMPPTPGRRCQFLSLAATKV
jgi:hypothetical protein